MNSSPHPLRRAVDHLAARLAALPSVVLYLGIFAAVALAHLTLLHLPYYWDEGGYYVPAALDFYHHWTLIPQFTNAHPPLPNVVLGLLWHVVGYHILATRLCAAAFAAAGLLAVFRLTQRLLSPTAAFGVGFLTAVYPIWFAQSTLAHADIFAAAFTLWGFALYLPARDSRQPLSTRRLVALAGIFSLGALAKETAIIEPATLTALELFLLLRNRVARREHLRAALALAFPVLPLIAWYAYHHHKTGFTFGNPEFLRYNATANFTIAHVLLALRYRFVHLFWQRNIWLPLVFAVSCLFLARRSRIRTLSPFLYGTIALIVVANWIAFSILGGALLTRYLLPVYPLELLVCVAVWRERTLWWPALAAFTAAAFISALWINPPVAFAPEDNLTYRDMIVVHQAAVHYLDQHYPHATVLTAWPMAAELYRPDLGYTDHRFKVKAVENFTASEIYKAAQDPGSFDTAVIFTTVYISPALQTYLVSHPDSTRISHDPDTRPLPPDAIAQILHGRIVWHMQRDGEWVYILRFDRAYEASLQPAINHLR